MAYQIKVYFDGGYNGQAYGSWQIEGLAENKSVSRQVWNGLTTSNMAEYMALIEALEWLQTLPKKSLYSIEIFGDSMLVVMQVRGRWKVRKPHLKPLCQRAVDLLKAFPDWKINWHRRNKSVSRFGH